MMEFEQDFLIREIKNFTNFLAKVLFHKESVRYRLAERGEDARTDELYIRLNHLVGKGELNAAEDLLFHEIDPGNPRYLELALDFYAVLNDFDDGYLQAHNFSREEVERGLKDASALFGVNVPGSGE